MTTTAMGLLFKNYKQLFVERRDERSLQLPLAGSPILILGLVVAYLYFVLRWGPRYMSNRKPYHLRNIIKAYNLIQVIANSILFLRIFYNVFVQYNEFSFHCQLIDYSRSQRGMDEVFFSYAYFGLKLLDLADTIFFVLLHFGRPLLSGDCQFPTFWLWYGFLQAIFVLALFLDFYLKAYSSQQTKANLTEGNKQQIINNLNLMNSNKVKS
ncbi:elongation of very long chain fatty acids protein 1-like isoform X2 [Anopheles darlingi]|uniref:elongation of very long chain fatty acids protein 1-like isoform X2 n=1 Tax=Anopheles darlingi TaxID=43151 RepID=UPI00210049AE|nr:elongation of very long chain fatty acids protein 1-like isoform X2 [Anopheles darlingi]